MAVAAMVFSRWSEPEAARHNATSGSRSKRVSAWLSSLCCNGEASSSLAERAARSRVSEDAKAEHSAGRSRAYERVWNGVVPSMPNSFA